MTDATPPAPPQAPAPPPVPPGTEPPEGDGPREGRLGTVLMTVAIAGIAVLALDVLLKGKLLAPLFALLPAPKAPATEDPDGGQLPDAPG